MAFTIIRNNIINVDADAVVNAANSSLAAGSGVCGAIFEGAGFNQMVKACQKIGHCDTGRAVITPGFHLKARYVIHAVGPVWQGGTENEEHLLRSCYRAALNLAAEYNCRSIAFPLISSGIYGYPKADAFRIACEEFSSFLETHDLQIILVVFDRKSLDIGLERRAAITAYIDDHYVESYPHTRRERTDPSFDDFSRPAGESGYGIGPDAEPTDIIASNSYPKTIIFAHPAEKPEGPTDDKAAPVDTGKPKKGSFHVLNDSPFHTAEPFNQYLLHLIDRKQYSDTEVYKRANIDRKLFSKIRRDGYTPSKQTVLALAVGLRLNLDEAIDLLGKAGYAFSDANLADVIIRYYIGTGNYDIFEINAVLFSYDLKLLGA